MAELTLGPHPAIADDPRTGCKLYVDGKPVPVFPDQRGVYLDGFCIGYVGPPPGYNTAIIYPQYKPLEQDVAKLVERELGKPRNVRTIKAPPVAPPEPETLVDFDEEF